MIASSPGSDRDTRAGLQNERGIALAVTLYALVVIGALVGGTLFAGRLEQQSGRNALLAVQAAEAAEAGLSEAIASITAASLESLSVGGTPLDLGTLALADGVSASRQVARLTGSLFLIRVRGVRHSAGTTLAVRPLGALVRLDSQSDGGADSGSVARLTERGWIPLY